VTAELEELERTLDSTEASLTELRATMHSTRLVLDGIDERHVKRVSPALAERLRRMRWQLKKLGG
jgi:hypothetical protein